MRKSWFNRFLAAIAMSCVFTFGAALMPCQAALAHNERAPRRELSVSVKKSAPATARGQAFSAEEKKALSNEEAASEALQNYEGGAALVIGISGGVILLIALVVLIVVLID
jgi:hypothetical protein